eukprot:747411-Pyramimonas_sp.AAC.2
MRVCDRTSKNRAQWGVPRCVARTKRKAPKTLADGLNKHGTMCRTLKCTQGPQDRHGLGSLDKHGTMIYHVCRILNCHQAPSYRLQASLLYVQPTHTIFRPPLSTVCE